MRVFMLGWEFPPFISGGLGTACYGLTKAMSSIGMDVLFVLPRPVSTPFSTHVKLVSPRAESPLAMPTTEFRLDEFDHVTFRTVNAALTSPYNTPTDYKKEDIARQTLAADVQRARRPVPSKSAASAPASTPGFLNPTRRADSAPTPATSFPRSIATPTSPARSRGPRPSMSSTPTTG